MLLYKPNPKYTRVYFQTYIRTIRLLVDSSTFIVYRYNFILYNIIIILELNNTKKNSPQFLYDKNPQLLDHISL